MTKSFSFARTPKLIFGAGKLDVLPSAIKAYGRRVVLVTGANSFLASGSGQKLLNTFQSQHIEWAQCPVNTEPSPYLIDDAVQKFVSFEPDCVVAIGGGSALDAGKAIAAMLPLRKPVKDYLEGVGTGAAHPGIKVSFIAVPTTAGTGSEATKNAVISERGINGYKRSLRHDNFVPDYAILDPLLTTTCPKEITAASGMDAFTQLLESYLSTGANPLSDTLALDGLRLVASSLLRTYGVGDDVEARGDMLYAAYLSGITLANAGLGVVHGFASPIGAYFAIPHGVICSALMGPANRITVRKLLGHNSNPVALKKYAAVGKLFANVADRSDQYYVDALLDVIDGYTSIMRIPALREFKISSEDIERIVGATENKNNPVALDRSELREVLEAACGRK